MWDDLWVRGKQGRSLDLQIRTTGKMEAGGSDWIMFPCLPNNCHNRSDRNEIPDLAASQYILKSGFSWSWSLWNVRSTATLVACFLWSSSNEQRWRDGRIALFFLILLWTLLLDSMSDIITLLVSVLLSSFLFCWLPSVLLFTQNSTAQGVQFVYKFVVVIDFSGSRFYGVFRETRRGNALSRYFNVKH